MVGDPSGRSEERNLLDAETLSYNVSCISEQLSRLLDFSPGKYAATLVNNADWLTKLSLLDFLRANPAFRWRPHRGSADIAVVQLDEPTLEQVSGHVYTVSARVAELIWTL